MPWYLTLAVGFILGVLTTRSVIVLCEYLPGRPVAPTPTRPPEPTQEPRQYGAAAILGYRDLGGRRIAPTHPATRGAQNSMQALIAWDGRRRNAA